MTTRDPKVSACIVCRNEADKLGPCLESAAWADEIVVLDLESVDGSADLARKHGARVLTHEPGRGRAERRRGCRDRRMDPRA